MSRIIKSMLRAGVFGVSASAGLVCAQVSDNTFSGKAALFSEYEYRGISQTSEKPAVQLNLDYAHKSGFYVGTFVSNINWLKDTANANGFTSNANIEWDIYGGFKFDVAKDVTIDIGYLHYEFPSAGAFIPKPNTDEVYVGASYGPAALKYAQSTSNTFGVENSKGSSYIEFAVNYPLPAMPKLTINALVAQQKYKNNGFLDYTVSKIGATYDLGAGLNVGAYFKNTDAKKVWYTVDGKDWSKNRLVGFVSYSF
ncbi:MAG TPA: hypothetical protein DEX10_01885 [Betaproteobacteria bacterium]|jgi:uncharacterized protein (TIGR02001 family)|nr:hypothetical protein [Betaproteobacteria bacterium]